MIDPEFRAKILKLLAEGESLSAICRKKKFPTRQIVNLWKRTDEEFATALREAREEGYQLRADAAVDAARKATDPALGRLAFDAERWYLGKLSNAFSDNKAQRHDHTVELKGIEIQFGRADRDRG